MRLINQSKNNPKILVPNKSCLAKIHHQKSLPLFCLSFRRTWSINHNIDFWWEDPWFWEKVVRIALKSKNKLGFIEGTLRKPTLKEEDDPLELEAWEMANSIVCWWILKVIDRMLRTSTTYVETAALIGENLKKWYAVSNAPKIHQLKTKLAECKQGGLEVVEFYSKLVGLL